jgi:hypothetical protein
MVFILTWHLTTTKEFQMANNITGTPWALDTAAPVWPYRLYIGNISWLNGSGSLLIQDQIGRDIIRDTWAASVDHNYGPIKWVNGLNVIVIGGGEVILTPQNK